MNDSSKDGEPISGQVLPPEPEKVDAGGDNYFALISQYTERPDLLIAELEKHDPGFVKRMNEKAEARAERMSDARFKFGGVQAYCSLAVALIAALSILGFIGYMVIAGSASFWLILAFAVFYAVTQGGPSGFLELCKGVADMFRSKKTPPEQ